MLEASLRGSLRGCCGEKLGSFWMVLGGVKADSGCRDCNESRMGMWQLWKLRRSNHCFCSIGRKVWSFCSLALASPTHDENAKFADRITSQLLKE